MYEKRDGNLDVDLVGRFLFSEKVNMSHVCGWSVPLIQTSRLFILNIMFNIGHILNFSVYL